MIAVPITASFFEEALEEIDEANGKADVIELRLDFLEEVNETILQELIEACKKPVIVTFRAENHGASVESTERLFLLQKAIDFGAHFIDIEFGCDEDSFREIVSSKGLSGIILSHHNFEKTPVFPKLLKLVEKMNAVEGADILKVVTFAVDEADNDTILSLIPFVKKLGKPIIAFCMGPNGKKSRVESVKMGAFLTFASLVKGEESASGQMTIEEMRKGLEK